MVQCSTKSFIHTLYEWSCHVSCCAVAMVTLLCTLLWLPAWQWLHHKWPLSSRQSQQGYLLPGRGMFCRWSGQPDPEYILLVLKHTHSKYSKTSFTDYLPKLTDYSIPNCRKVQCFIISKYRFYKLTTSPSWPVWVINLGRFCCTNSFFPVAIKLEHLTSAINC